MGVQWNGDSQTTPQLIYKSKDDGTKFRPHDGSIKDMVLITCYLGNQIEYTPVDEGQEIDSKENRADNIKHDVPVKVESIKTEQKDEHQLKEAERKRSSQQEASDRKIEQLMQTRPPSLEDGLEADAGKLDVKITRFGTCYMTCGTEGSSDESEITFLSGHAEECYALTKAAKTKTIKPREAVGKDWDEARSKELQNWLKTYEVVEWVDRDPSQDCIGITTVYTDKGEDQDSPGKKNLKARTCT